jgi:hypothetical protein
MLTKPINSRDKYHLNDASKNPRSNKANIEDENKENIHDDTKVKKYQISAIFTWDISSITIGITLFLTIPAITIFCGNPIIAAMLSILVALWFISSLIYWFIPRYTINSKMN